VSVLSGERAASVRIDDGEETQALLRPIDGIDHALTWAGRTRMLRLTRNARSVWVADDGFSVELPILSREQRLAARLALISRNGSPSSPEVRSPMPGTVISVEAVTGDRVEAGDTLVVVEAMKMEHKLVASVPGEVTVHVAPGDLVKLDQLVATLVPSAQPDPSTVEGDTE
jgi:acetyl-CoA/propionyl-CoA carboxylase biotin carboxyl carrier protein